MSISVNKVANLTDNNSTFTRGQSYFYQGHVKQVELVELEGGTEIRGVVEGHGSDYESYLEIDDDQIKDYGCECLAYEQYQGACKHIIALGLYYLYEIQERQLHFEKQVEKMSQTALDYYEDQVIKEQDLEIGEHPTIKVYPKLIENAHGEFLLGLSLGATRAYVVKDLYEFTINMVQGNNVSYGKNLEFIHDMSLFEESSRPIVQFVMDKTLEYNEVLKQAGLYRGFTKSERKTIPLGAKALDEFFDLVKWTVIDFDGYTFSHYFSKTYTKLECIDANPIFSITLGQSKKYYELKTSLECFVPFSCPNNKYLLIEDKLYRLSKEFGRDVFPLLVYMYEGSIRTEHKRLLFKEEAMKRFLLSSLDKLKRHLPFVVEQDISEKLKVEHVQLKMYFDMDEGGKIVGEVICYYGDLHFNPYKRLIPTERETINQLVRDVPKESRLNSILRNYDFRNANGKLYLEEDENIYGFLNKGLMELLEIGEVNVTDKLKQVKIVKNAVGAIGLRIENNMLHVALREVQMPLDEMHDILSAYKAKSRYYRLRDGSFIDIEGSSIQDMANIVEGLGLSGRDLEGGEAILPKYRALYLDQLLKQSETIEVERDKYFKQIIRDVKNIEDADYEVPKTIKATLRSYQKRGYRWLKTMAAYGFGGILADDMGLGKTLQMITLIDSEYENVGDKLSLVVCPTSLSLNWQNEIKRFAPRLKTLIVAGSMEERKALLEESSNYDILITSYELLKRDIEYYQGLMFRYCIADEAQYIKNANTLSAKSLKIIKSEVRFALTGTPIENSLAELWSIFDFIMPGYLFNYTEFKNRFELPIIKGEDEKAIWRLKKMVAPFILRRLKKDVLKELPDKTETVIYNFMEEMQRKLYVAHLAKAKEEMEIAVEEKGMQRSHIKLLSLLTRLRQLCCHPGLYLENYEAGCGKLEQCMEIVRDSIAAGHRILLFSQFTSMLDILSKTLKKEEIEHYMLTGSTKAEERMRLVDSFNHSNVPVFLISLKAGGTGLNLTGADVVIHYDPWWNLSSQNQATDRAYRIGQKNNVQVFQLITKDSIEEKIKELQDKKLSLTEGVLQEGETLITKMTDEELKSLFEL
ncbi:DEAD/DEAH box helicase [Sporanaerobium hydrogeniformans]|uniref:DEAD/DEAH box helicase n=1 Tax=Sporanaerobium hydrogeniformans TaxID=3072179 RepID=UPI0015D51CE0|nr:SNF2 helicase associated domain-containing protein [Sporanaerobium hydrogeniformans]